MAKDKAASTMGSRVQVYSQSAANFRLSTMKKGAPNPFNARLITVSKVSAPVKMTRTRPITDGIGSAQPGQS